MGTTEFEGQRLSVSRMPELGTYGSKGARGGDAPKLPKRHCRDPDDSENEL